jgi:O-antigen ligase
MKNLFLIDDTTANRISYYHLACFLAALPFDFFYSEIILISFGLHTILNARKANLKNIFAKPVLILISIYLLGLAAILYSPDKPEAINVATRQLAILIFPVLFALSDLNLEKYKLNLMRIFGFACTATILYLYADALHTIYYFHLPLSSLFTLIFMNHNFSMPIEIHATYLSVYTAFSLLVFLFLLFSKQGLRQKWIYIISALILSVGMLQLSSRAVFIAFLVIINLVFPFFLFRGKKRLIFFLAASFISTATLMAIFSVDSFKERYISELKVDLTNNVKIIENTEPRLARWRAIMELVKKSPVIGHGSGSEKELLKDKYFEKGLYNSYLNEFNAHNEYLSILVKTGIIGLALFIYVLYFGFAAAIRNKDILFLNFMVIITIVSVSENILDLNKGIFFYSFFFSLFLWSGYTGDQQNIKPLISKTGNRE